MTESAGRGMRPWLWVGFAAVLLFGVLAPVPSGPVGAGPNPSADIDQCKNGPTASPVSPCDWVNGNLGTNNSHYAENQSVPFRIKFANLATGAGSPHTVTIEWDTTKQGKHAYDYLTTFNRTEANADPCQGVGGCTLASPSSTLPIPLDANVTVPQIAGSFTMWDGTLTGASSYTTTGTYGADSSTRLTLTFTATSAKPVLAWSGHIAYAVAWGTGTSAVNITGSPYHMRLLDLDGSGGNQDRSLKVLPGATPGSITIVKQATPEGSRGFGFTATDNLGTFTLVDDGTAANTKRFDDLVDFHQGGNTNTYDFTETVPTGWALSSITCDSDDYLVTGATVKVELQEETNVVCTFTNANVAPTITVTKTANTTTVPEPGGSVTYTVTVTNTSSEPVTVTGLDDDMFDDLTDDPNNAKISASDCHTIGSLTAGTSGSCTFTATVSGNAGFVHANEVTATAEDEDGASVTADDDAIVTVTDVLPTIAVDKTASTATVRTGSSVTYTYKVTTPGAEPLVDVAVTDDKCAPVAFVGGDSDNDGALDPTETWTYTCTSTLTGDTVNTATATAEDDEGNTTSATDTASVDVIDPRIAIDKVANPTSANPGHTVVYSYAVTNPGDQPLSDVVVVDDKCSPVAFVGGDSDNDGKLDPGETWTYTCSVVIGTSGTFVTNIGTVTAKDPTGAAVSADDAETISVVDAVVLEREREAPAIVAGVDLPRTGGQVVTWLALALGLVSLGFAFVVAGGRRRRSDSPF